MFITVYVAYNGSSAPCNLPSFQHLLLFCLPLLSEHFSRSSIFSSRSFFFQLLTALISANFGLNTWRIIVFFDFANKDSLATVLVAVNRNKWRGTRERRNTAAGTLEVC